MMPPLSPHEQQAVEAAVPAWIAANQHDQRVRAGNGTGTVFAGPTVEDILAQHGIHFERGATLHERRECRVHWCRVMEEVQRLAYAELGRERTKVQPRKAKRVKQRTFVCAHCGGTFPDRRGGRQKHCTQRCAALARWASEAA